MGRSGEPSRTCDRGCGFVRAKVRLGSPDLQKSAQPRCGPYGVKDQFPTNYAAYQACAPTRSRFGSGASAQKIPSKETTGASANRNGVEECFTLTHSANSHGPAAEASTVSPCAAP